MRTYIVCIDGNTEPGSKTFTKKDNEFMNGVWTRFNAHARARGHTERVQSGSSLGGLAWRHPQTGSLMELRAASEEDQAFFAKKKPVIITTDFQSAHGRMPRGRGSWGFFMGSRDDLETLFFTPSLTYTEARKLALREGRRRNVDIIYVAS